MRLSSNLLSLSIFTVYHFHVGANVDNLIRLDDASDYIGSDEGTVLSCHHDSFLTEGSKNYATIFPEDMINTLPFLQESSKDDKYCDCRDKTLIFGKGYTGIDCAIPYEKCRDDSICFHGAPCVSDEKYHCACPLTTYPLDESFVGESCEYQVTSYCEQTPSTDDEFNEFDGLVYDISASGKWYCTNGGYCRDGILRPIEKCKCKDGFYGLHCEFMEEPVCDLECFNKGECKNGVKDYSSLSEELQAYFYPDIVHDTHCICPQGFTGRQCGTDISTCGDNHCLNGGICKNESVCGCTDASKLEDGKVLKFAGSSCESQISSFCEAPSGYDPMSFFCTNNGECPEQHWKPCKCGPDYSGPRCEFLVEKNKECNLQCQNEGTCFFGNTPPSSHPDITGNTDSVDLDISSKCDEMHCKCPEGFSGSLCNIQICGDYEHFCMNTGSCVQSNDSYTCDCAANATDVVYAGVNCKFAATTFCEGHGVGSHTFCTNEGTCKPIVGEEGDHPGCECSDEFMGDFCEISASEQEIDKSTRGALFFIIIAVTALGVYVGGIMLIIHRSRISRERKNTTIDNPPEIHASNGENDNKMKISKVNGMGTFDEYDNGGDRLQDVEIS